MMKKLALTLALATSFGPSMYARQEVQTAPVEAPEQNQQEESTLKKVWNSKWRRGLSASTKITFGAFASFVYCFNMKTELFDDEDASLGQKILFPLLVPFVVPFKELKEMDKFEGSSGAAIPFFAGTYFLYSGIAGAVKLVKEIKKEKEENKDQEPELVPAQ